MEREHPAVGGGGVNLTPASFNQSLHDYYLYCFPPLSFTLFLLIFSPLHFIVSLHPLHFNLHFPSASSRIFGSVVASGRLMQAAEAFVLTNN